MLSVDYIEFILAHDGCDTASLLLQKDRYPDLDIPLIATILEARAKIRTKIPSWYAFPALVFTSSLSVEQSSSEATATYKQRFAEGKCVADLTGGLGVDSFFFSLVAKKVTYIERQRKLCDAAKENFKVLGAENIEVLCGDSKELLDNIEKQDLIFIDPARRSKTSSRVYSIADSEPNLLEMLPLIFRKTDTVLVKISPMADISRTVELLPQTSEVHIVTSSNECKEILLLLKKDAAKAEPSIFAEGFTFTMKEEQDAVPTFSAELGKYLYMPSKGMMKAGTFKLLSQRFSLAKLAVSTHLYTGMELLAEYPGRVFEVIESVQFKEKNFKYLRHKYDKANIIALNLPVDTNALRRRLDIQDGGDIYLIGCKILEEKVVIAAKLVSL